ncbi:unnamed protein product [Symbiodinium microadriaticum]|nr:unnamed protein product [Symbiodinium microadriaticum]
MPLRCQTELERWHRQLSKRADHPNAGCARDTPNQIDVAMQLARTVSALRSEPDGPELYRLNDAANELMRMLPVTHSTRKAAAREGLVLPGRPNYRYFGRCAELRYVVEAVQSLHAEKTEGPELAAETATAEAAAPSAMSTKQNGGLTVQLLARSAFGSLRWCRAVRLTASRLEAVREDLLQARARRAAEWQDRLDQAAKRRRIDQEQTQTEPNHTSDCESQEVGGSLGAQDGLPDDSTALIRNLVSGKAGPLTLPDFQQLFIASRGRWSEAVILLEELRRRDLQPTAFQWQRDYGWVTTALETSGMWQKALELLKGMALSDLELNHVAETASGWRLRGGAGKNARKEATEALLNPRLRKMLILRLYTAKAKKDAEDVEAVATTLRSYGVPKPRDYVVLLSAYGAVSLWPSALGVLEEMQTLQFAPYIVSYNAALKACERGCQWSAALALFHDMPNVMLTPDQISYTALIESLGQQKLWEEALQLLARMDTEGTAPDVVAYSAAMAACAGVRKWWLSLGLLAELEARFIKDIQGLYGHSSECLRMVAEVEALGIGEELPEDPDEDPELEKKWQEFRCRHQVSDVSDAIAEEDWKAAEQVVHTLGPLGKQREIDINSYIYRAAIGAISRSHKVEMACAVLDEMFDRFALTAAVTDVVSGCADVSDWCRAIHLLTLPDHPDTVLYNAVMEACGRAAQWERATHILQQLAVERLSPSAVTFNTLLSCYVRCKRTGEVETLLRSMQDFRVALDRVTESLLEDEALLRSARIQALRRGTITPLENGLSLHEGGFALEGQRPLSQQFPLALAQKLFLYVLL